MCRLLILVMAWSLSACTAFDTMKDSMSGIADYFSGGEDNADPPAQLTELDATQVDIEVLWEASIGVGADEKNIKLGLAALPDRLIVANREGLVEARNLQTGDTLWSTDTQLPLSGGIGLGDGLAVLGSSNAEVIALDTQTGQVRWKSTVSSEVLASPVLAKNKVVVRTTDGNVFALDDKTGGKLWSYEHNVPALSLRGMSTPLVVNDSVIVGFDNGKLIALDIANGKYTWETGIAIAKGRSEVERLVDLDADMVQTNDVVYVASYRGGMAAVSASDGDMLWQNTSISSYLGLSHDFRYVYLTDAHAHVWQIDQRSGAGLWQQKELHHRRLTAPVTYQNYIVVGDFEGYVHWLSSTDGHQLGRVQVTDAPIENPPIAVDDIVYIYAKDGTLSALKMK